MAKVPKKTHPGAYEIKELTVQNYAGIMFDISSHYHMIDIFESIYAPTLQMNIWMNDAVGLLETVPFFGEEKIFITFTANNREEAVRRIFHVYEIDNITEGNTTAVSYRVKCVSPEAILNTRLRVYNAYSRNRYSDMARKIYEEYFNRQLKDIFSRAYDKPFNIEPTKDQFTIAFPGMHPFEALNMIAKRSQSDVDSQKITGALFFFWETLQGYYFRSLETIMLRFNHLRAENSIEDIPKFVVKPKQLGNSEQLEEADFYGVEDFGFEKYFNTLENTQEGMYTRKLLAHNLLNMTIDEHEFFYDRDGFNQAHLNPNKALLSSKALALAPPESEKKGSKHNQFAHVQVFPLNGSETAGQNNKVNKWMMNRESQVKQLEAVKLSCVVPCDDRVEAGSCVFIEFQSRLPYADKKEKYRSGAYLVTDIHHQIRGDKYMMRLDLSKETYETALDAVFKVENPNQQIDPDTGNPMSHSKTKTPSQVAKRTKQRGADESDTDDAMYRLFQFSSESKEVPAGPRPKESIERVAQRSFPGNR